VKGAQLGAFDLVYCGEQSEAKHKPDAMIFDAPSVYYEIRKRKDSLGKCPLLTVGEQFFTSGFALGFPKNNHYSRAFSVAIQKGVQNGTVGALEKEFNISGDGFPCHETTSTSTGAVLMDMVMGVFLFSLGFILIGTVQGIVGGLPSGKTMRVVKACTTCKTQDMPEEDEEEEEEEEEEGAEEEVLLPAPQTRVGKLCGQTQRMEEYLERLKKTL